MIAYLTFLLCKECLLSRILYTKSVKKWGSIFRNDGCHSMPFRGRIRIHDFQVPGRTAMEYQLSGIIYQPGKIIAEW